MKKLLLFFLFISGVIYAQPSIEQPDDLYLCDVNQVGFSTFDLTANNLQILNGLNASLYEIKFYTTLSNAIADSNFIITPTTYTSSSNMETIFIRVYEIANITNYVTSNFNLIVNPLPFFTLENVTACEGTTAVLDSGLSGSYLFEWYYNGILISGATGSSLLVTQTGTYALTSSTASGCIYSDEAVVTFLPEPVASISGPNFVSSGTGVSLTFTGTPNAVVEYTYSIDNPTDLNTLLVVISPNGNAEVQFPPFTTSLTVCLNSVSLNSCTNSLTNCKTVLVSADGIVDIPDANFKAKLLEASPSNLIAKNLFGNFFKIDANNDGEIQYTEALQVSFLDVQCFSNFVCDETTKIYGLQGVEFFTALEYLNCRENLIGTLNVSALVNLKSLICDSNVIQNINLSGLMFLETLICSNNQLIMIDVQNLNNLNSFECQNNQLANLDISGLSNLSVVNCGSNNIINLNVNGLANLISLNCSSNNIVGLSLNELVNLKVLEISGNNLINFEANILVNLEKLTCSNNFQINNLNVSGMNSLQELECSNSLLTNLNLNGLTSLTKLTCVENNLTTLDVSPCINLKLLAASSNALTTIDLTGLSALESLGLSNNLLSQINLEDLTSLKNFYCDINSLTSINLAGLSNLLDINCNGNLITQIDFSDQTNLINLKCGNNQLTNLDVSLSTSLKLLNCQNNQLSFLDLNNLHSLDYLWCMSNQLETLLIKNNNVSWYNLNFSNQTSNSTYVCVDSEDVAMVENIIFINGLDSIILNSYCSFTPGGNYNTITGSIKFDSNNNGCDATDLPQPNIRININDGTNQGSTFTSNTGNYSFFTQTGSFTLNSDVENPSWFNFSPSSATIPFADNNENVAIQNFCLSANGIHRDLEIVIVPILPARPGFDAIYKIVYKNKGNQTVQGFVNFTFNDNLLDFVSSSVVPNNNAAGFMNWIIPNIAPFQSGSILVTLNVNSPQEIPAVNIGNILAFNAFIDVTTDDIWADNNFDFSQTVVGSYDPNDITCLQGNALATSEIGKYLHYNIRFENTGTAPAENIVVKNVIDLAQYDIQSLQIMESSNPVVVRITGNIAEFIFQSIDLDTGGHGNILLKLKSNVAIPDNEVINSADIYFDYNFPIFTNDEQTVFEDLSKDDFTKEGSIQVYPNPANDVINIKADSVINSIQLFDVQGRILSTKLSNENTAVLDLSNYPSGVYFIQISTDKGIQTQKVMRK